MTPRRPVHLDPSEDADAALAAAADHKATAGPRTTEFWLSLAVMVCALVLGLAGRIGGEVAMGAVTVAGTGYAVSRGIAKT